MLSNCVVCTPVIILTREFGIPVGVWKAGSSLSATSWAFSLYNGSPVSAYIERNPPTYRMLVSNTKKSALCKSKSMNSSGWIYSKLLFLLTTFRNENFLAIQSRPSWYCSFKPIIYNVSKPSTIVKPRSNFSNAPPSNEVFFNGRNSFLPQAYIL